MFNTPNILIVKDACYKLFLKQHHGALAVKSQEELTRCIERGFTKVVVVHAAMQEELTRCIERGFTKVVVVHAAMHANVTRASAYITSNPIRERTPHEVLDEWYQKHRYDVHEKSRASFRDLLSQAKHWRSK